MRLDRINTAKLYNWLDSNREKVPNYNYPELTSIIIKDIGFEISVISVANMVRDMGITKKSRPTEKIPDYIKVMAKAILNIEKQFNIPHNPELISLAVD